MVAVVVSAVLAVTMLAPASPSPRSSPRTPSLPTGPITDTGVVPQIAWADYYGQLHIGDLAGLTQRVVAQADADPTASLVSLDHTIFWVRAMLPNSNQTVDPIPNPMVQGFDTTTGTHVHGGTGYAGLRLSRSDLPLRRDRLRSSCRVLAQRRSERTRPCNSPTVGTCLIRACSAIRPRSWRTGFWWNRCWLGMGFQSTSAQILSALSAQRRRDCSS